MINENANRSTLTIGSTKVSVEIADDLGEQLTGLSWRDSLCENCGMLFVYKQPQIQNFWMRGMKFPLDFVFIREGRVVEIVEKVQANDAAGNVSQVQSREPADMVLELNAGFVAKHNITTGQSVKY